MAVVTFSLSEFLSLFPAINTAYSNGDITETQITENFDTVTEAKQKTHSHVDRALKDPNKILAGFKWQYVD